MSREKTIKVHCYDQEKTHFADFDMPELPRKDDTLEIGFPNEQVVKYFTVWRVVHRMVQLPRFRLTQVEGVAIRIENDPPWRWEYHIHGYLYDPTKDVPSSP